MLVAVAKRAEVGRCPSAAIASRERVGSAELDRWVFYYLWQRDRYECVRRLVRHSRPGATTMSRSGAVSLKLRGYFVFDELFNFVKQDIRNIF